MTRAADARVLPGVPGALARLSGAGFALVVVTNQAVVARGLLDESILRAVQTEIGEALIAQGAPTLDGFYYCPHHPSADRPEYRVHCACRKPNPGLLLKAAEDLDIDLEASYMVGDRPTDLIAGTRAGCRSIWVQSGRHDDPPIEITETRRELPQPAFVCGSLAEAAAWILEGA